MKKRWIVAAVVCLVLLPILTVQACGPDFAPDVFVREMRPDQPKEFAAGKLGIVLPTYPRMDLMVAFRYLNGGVLDAQEQRAYTPTYSMLEEDQSQTSPTEAEQQKPDGAAAWAAAHEKYAGHSEEISPDRSVEIRGQDFTYQSSYINCNEDAFRTAAATLQSRADTWGGSSAWLKDWIRGQDAVFANCSGGPAMPAAVPEDAPALLKVDYAYQTAAALFYAGKLNEARDAFAAIHKDTASPWQGIAGYVEARCLIRQAFLSHLNAGQTPLMNFDPAQMREAASLLQAMLAGKHAGISRAAIEKELNLVRIRIEPLVRMRELSALVAGPAADPSYGQDLTDLTWLLNQNLQSIPLHQDVNDQLFTTSLGQEHPTETQRAAGYNSAYEQTADMRAASPMIDWAITLQTVAPDAKAHAITQWQKTSAQYWLVVALTKATGTDAATPSLIAAAAKLDHSSAAWETATYHRARLLMETGKTEEARALLDQRLPQLRATQQDSAVNLYQSLRMAAAKDLNGFLEYAPQKMLLRTSEADWASKECLNAMKDPKRKYDCVQKIDDNQFNDVAAGFFNAQAPLSVLVEAAKSNALPPQLRQAVTLMAWTRSILLKDDAAAKELLPLLPAQLQNQAGSGTGFQAIVTLVRNPGLRPYLETGVQRSYTYDFIESFRDNWWCPGLQSSWGSGPTSFSNEPVTFLTDAQRQAAAKELGDLKAEEGAKLYLGDQVLSYVKEHADEPRAAESLYLVLRMIRYGCDGDLYYQRSNQSDEATRIDSLKKDVARLLRQRYAVSPWTKKAAPFAG